ncbi:signal peptidase I [Actinokineospora auranticolor]|uniref:Signal peptidase I n=1 Tax=Actinokineospora auranticolor TaxID=155976 RepID=A0A2S6GGR3_9PSEU|nr:signal peptidase I [Actinokineospora auranticolor]
MRAVTPPSQQNVRPVAPQNPPSADQPSKSDTAAAVDSPSRRDLPAVRRTTPGSVSRRDMIPVPELYEPPDIEAPEDDDEPPTALSTTSSAEGRESDADLTALIPRVRARTRERYPGSGADGGRDKESEDRRKRGGRHRRPPRRQPLWREILTLVAIALVLTFLIQHFVGRVYSIPSGSMEQTLHGCPGCEGDRVFVDKVVYRFRDPTPGDVVVFEGPNTWTEHDVKSPPANFLVNSLRYAGSFIGIAPPDERDFVKRVIAVGGQTVECCDDQNRVLVDGKPLDEPYVYWENGVPNSQMKFDPVTVPEGTLWVMGDNRNNSSDSRIQGGGGVRGVVPLGKVIGKARYIVLPPSRWRGIGDHNPQAGPDLSAAGWQEGVPIGVGFAGAWPVLWIGRRLKNVLVPRKAD